MAGDRVGGSLRMPGRGPTPADQLARDRGDAVDDVFVRFRQHHRSLEGEHVLQGLEDDREWIVGIPGQQQCFQGTKQQLGMRLRLRLVVISSRRDARCAQFCVAFHRL
jgi:hypothetical protein